MRSRACQFLFSGAVAPQISIGLTNWAGPDFSGWDRLLDRGRTADQAGFDRVVVSDHVVLGENLEAYSRPELGGLEGGRQPTGPDGQWLEPLTVLSVLAGITNRVRLGTNILLAALRRPVVLAKATATLDVLSGGRLDLGVGVGWQREEYVAAGLEFERRGRLLDHTLEVCRALWSEAPASYDSSELSFEDVYCSPRPAGSSGIPLWISGTVNRRVARRLARFGAGWIPGARPQQTCARGSPRWASSSLRRVETRLRCRSWGRSRSPATSNAISTWTGPWP